MFRKLTAVAFGLSLAACGGGGDPAPTPTPTPVPVPVPVPPAPPACTPLAQVRIQLFGDSTQVGYDGSTNQIAAVTPLTALQAALTAEFGVGKTLVTSRAVQGTTSQELIAGTDGLNQPWPKSVDADIVVINHGINDMTRYGGPRFSEYTASLRTLAVAPARVIFETQNITKGWDSGPYAEAMRAVAREVKAPIADVYAYTSSLPDWQTQIPDWAHPSSALYDQIGTKVLAPVVAAEVRTLLCK